MSDHTKNKYIAEKELKPLLEESILDVDKHVIRINNLSIPRESVFAFYISLSNIVYGTADPENIMSINSGEFTIEHVIVSKNGTTAEFGWKITHESGSNILLTDKLVAEIWEVIKYFLPNDIEGGN